VEAGTCIIIRKFCLSNTVFEPWMLTLFLQLKQGIPLLLPERFYLHKLIVSQKRQNPSKALKDLEQAKTIREVLN